MFVVAISLRRLLLDPTSVGVGIVVDKFALVQVLYCQYICCYMSVSFQQSSIIIFIYMLLLPEGQAGEAWKLRNKAMLFRKDQKIDCLCVECKNCVDQNGTLTAYSPQFGNCSVPHGPAVTNVATFRISRGAYGNMLFTWIAHQPCFGQREQSEGEVTSASWKDLFAKTFSAETQEIVKQNVYNLVWQTLCI
jgi:hypothetical protein